MHVASLSLEEAMDQNDKMAHSKACRHQFVLTEDGLDSIGNLITAIDNSIFVHSFKELFCLCLSKAAVNRAENGKTWVMLNADDDLGRVFYKVID